MFALTNRCKILPVKGSGDSILRAISLIPQRLPSEDSDAI